MKLTSITATNLKGWTGTVQLEAANIIIGDNFSGKSSITDAVRLLLLGYLPELGKTNVATFQLASGRSMSVEGVLDNGQKISRTWESKGNSIMKREALPAELMDVDLAVMLNAEEYFGLSDLERVKYVFGHIGIADERFTIMAIGDRISKKFPDQEVLQQLGHGVIENETPQQWLEAEIEVAVDALKDTKRHAEQMEKTVQGLSHLRLQDEASPNIGTMVPREQLVKAVEDALQRKSDLASRLQTQVLNDSRRHTLSRTIETSKKGRPQMEELRITVQDMLDKINAAPLPSRVTDATLKLFELQSAQTSSRNEVRTCKATLERIAIDLSELGGRTVCPYCGASGEGWKALKKDELENQKRALETTATIHEEALQEATVAVEAQHKELTEAKKAAAAFDALAAECRGKQETLHSFERVIGQLEAQEAELAAVPVKDELLSTNLQEAMAAHAKASQELAAADMRIKAQTIRQQDLKRLAEAEAAREVGKKDIEVLKGVSDELRAIQAEMVEAAFGPLLKTANSMFPGLALGLEYHEGGIGVWREGVWVGHKTMSGTEKALVYASIQAALASASPIRIMLIDEMGRVTGKNVETMLFDSRRQLGVAIDQLILIDTSDRKALYGIPGLNMILV